ncbi:hypothetical protein AGMMS49940_20020 [Spirochaetia bacterium]|nr:hypothetical protein AGMMS49940_20020 [Spirochaetia bacterium]
MEVFRIIIAPVCGIIGALLVAFINNKNTDKKFHRLFYNHLHGLSPYLKVLNAAMLKKQIIDEIDKQRLDNAISAWHCTCCFSYALEIYCIV